MDTSKYDLQIQEARSELEQLRKRMATVRLAFLKAAEGFCAEWFQKTIESAVISKPEVSKSLGVERLRELKSELKQLIDKVPDLVKQHLAQERYWPHFTELPDDIHERGLTAYDIGKRASDGLHYGGRELLGYAGQLLIAYSFDDAGIGSAWEKRPGKPPRYRYGYSWSTEMDTLWKEYTELIDSLVETTIKLGRSEKAKAAAEAKYLWDQA